MMAAFICAQRLGNARRQAEGPGPSGEKKLEIAVAVVSASFYIPLEAFVLALQSDLIVDGIVTDFDDADPWQEDESPTAGRPFGICLTIGHAAWRWSQRLDRRRLI